MVKAPTIGKFWIGHDPNDMSQGFLSTQVTIAWHSIEPHYPPIFNTFMQMSTMHLFLSQKISILQIKMMGVLVMAKTTLLSL